LKQGIRKEEKVIRHWKREKREKLIASNAGISTDDCFVSVVDYHLLF
jgi:hypothetical protein